MLSLRSRRLLPRRLLPRRAAAPAVLLAAALALTACSSGGGDGDGAASSSASSAAVTADLSAITVADPAAGATGADLVPEVTVPAPFSVTETTADVRTEGDGEAVEAGDVVTVDFVGVNGADGKQFGSSSFTDASPVSFVLGDGVIPGFVKALTGVKAGSRVVVAVPPADGYGPQGGLEQAGIGADDTLVYLIDVKSVAPGWATGEAVDPASLPAGLPTVALDPTTHAPTITVDTAATPPADLVVQTLIKGTGPVVQDGQTLTVQYTGVTWSTGEVFDSSWTKGSPFALPLGQGQVIKGWDQGLQGVTVGSQVLLVIPPELGYGAEGSGEAIPGGSTLVFVVDVLAAQ